MVSSAPASEGQVITIFEKDARFLHNFRAGLICSVVPAGYGVLMLAPDLRTSSHCGLFGVASSFAWPKDSLKCAVLP